MINKLNTKCSHVFRTIVWPGFNNPLDAQCMKCHQVVPR